MSNTNQATEVVGVGRAPGGSARGAKTFPSSDSRKYNYFEPKKRHASLYENVTVDVLPDVDRHLLQGWIIGFGDGMEAYDKRRTALKSSDWHVYRAPDGEWERNHFQRQAAVETMIQQVVDHGRAAKAVENFDKQWLPILEKHLGALAECEFGLHYATMSGQRDGTTQMINNSILTHASQKIRLAQDLVLYIAELGLEVEMDTSAGKRTWLEDPMWQKTRELVEHIMAGPDFLEQYFAINFVCEPLVTESLRSGFFMQLAACHSDFMTPVVLSGAENDFDRNLENAIEMFGIIARDEKYAEDNKKVFDGWLNKYVPMAVAAMEQLQPLWSQPRVKHVSYVDAYEAAKNRLTVALSEASITLPDGIKI